MQLVFSDSHYWSSFLPLTFTKPIAELRCGILTFKERWQKLLAVENIFYNTEEYLTDKYPKPEEGDTLYLIPTILPSNNLLTKIRSLSLGEGITYNGEIIAARYTDSIESIHTIIDIDEELIFFQKATDLFTFNKEAIDYDFELLTKNRESQTLSSTNQFIGDKKDLFIEPGAKVECSSLNTTTGKIYIGKNAEIMESSAIRGSLALCEGAKLNLGAKVYGPTTIGPYSKVGGEVNNIVIIGYSNKGHDGFVGNSVIGEWCNLGADTNSSNLKNNYAEVKIWNYEKGGFKKTGLQFCGLIMGDHSKTAINTQFNTGTVVGVGANIFKTGFPPNKIEHFSWGGMKGDEKFKLEKAFEVSEIVMSRRNVDFTKVDEDILKFIFENY